MPTAAHKKSRRTYFFVLPLTAPPPPPPLAPAGAGAATALTCRRGLTLKTSLPTAQRTAILPLPPPVPSSLLSSADRWIGRTSTSRATSGLPRSTQAFIPTSRTAASTPNANALIASTRGRPSRSHFDLYPAVTLDQGKGSRRDAREGQGSQRLAERTHSEAQRGRSDTGSGAIRNVCGGWQQLPSTQFVPHATGGCSRECCGRDAGCGLRWCDALAKLWANQFSLIKEEQQLLHRIDSIQCRLLLCCGRLRHSWCRGVARHRLLSRCGGLGLQHEEHGAAQRKPYGCKSKGAAKRLREQPRRLLGRALFALKHARYEETCDACMAGIEVVFFLVIFIVYYY